MVQNRKMEIRSKISKIFEPEENFQCDAYEYNENKLCMVYIGATDKRIVVFHEQSNNSKVKSKSFDMINDVYFDDNGYLLIELNDEMLKLSEKSFTSDLDRLHSFLSLKSTQEKMKKDKIAKELKTYKRRKERKINGGKFMLIAGITVIVTAAITLGVGFAFNKIENLQELFNDNKLQSELLEQQNTLYQAEEKVKLLNAIDTNLVEMANYIKEYSKLADEISVAASNDYVSLQTRLEAIIDGENSKRVSIPKEEDNIKLKKKYLNDNVGGLYQEIDDINKGLLKLIKDNSSSAMSYIEVSSAYNALNEKIEMIRKDISIEKTAQKEYVEELKKINP